MKTVQEPARDLPVRAEADLQDPAVGLILGSGQGETPLISQGGTGFLARRVEHEIGTAAPPALGQVLPERFQIDGVRQA